VKRCLVLLALLSASCSNPAVGPSLAPRGAEAIDPRLPVADTSGDLPGSAELRSRAGVLLAQARSGVGVFEQAAAAAERAANDAGARESDSWLAAQQLLSAAVAARYPVSRALGDVDAMVATAVEGRGGLVPADLANVRTIAAEIDAIDAAQASRIDAIQARLAR
jgi:hypothetical protein